MGIYKLVKKEDTSIRVNGDSNSIRNYLTKDFNTNFSLAVSELDGIHQSTKSTVNDRIYYFIEGTATFIINGEKINVKQDDTLFIEKNTEYSFEGKIRAVLINMPAFGIENDINK